MSKGLSLKETPGKEAPGKEEEVIVKKKDEINIEDLPGVGAATAEKLREAGYTSLMSLAVASPGELVEVCAVGEAVAKKIINNARNKLDMGFESGEDLLKKRLSVIKITTGSKALDGLFGGGIETGAVTEVYGAYGSGKTSLAHQLAVSVQLPKEKGGAEGIALWIDSEGTLRPEFIERIAKAYGLDTAIALKNFRGARAFNSDHQMLMVEKIEELIRDQGLPIKLVIVDSLMSYFRSEFSGRGQLADRQQKLNRHIHELLKLAHTCNLAVYITNQVMAKPDTFFGDPTEAIGGHVLHHACLRADTLLQLGDGSIVPINSLKGPVTMVSNDLNNSMKNMLTFCDRGVANKEIKTIYKIDTGNEIEASGKHRFFRLNNFKIEEARAEELREGDYLAIPSILNVNGEEQKLPKVESKSLIRLNKNGLKFLEENLKDLGLTRKEVCDDLEINARQFRRVVNQQYPMGARNIQLLVQQGVNEKIFDYVEAYTSQKFREITIPETLTVELSQVLGYFIGDGTTNENSVKFKDQRIEVLQEYNNLIKKLFGIEGKIEKVKGKNCFELVVNSRVVVKIFNYLREKAFVYIGRSKKEHVKSFIKGFADAEGYVSKKRPRFIISQKDKRILQGLQLLLLRFGVRSRLNVQKGRNKISYNLLFDNRDFLAFAENIGVTAIDKRKIIEGMIDRVRKSVAREVIPISAKEMWQLLKEEGLRPYKLLHKSYKYINRNKLNNILNELDNVNDKRNVEKIAFLKKIASSELRFEKIRKITKQENDEQLYDISVPVLENYIANGFLVHNSTYRCYLRRGKKGSRVAKLVDAPAMPENECIFIVTDQGIRDVQ